MDTAPADEAARNLKDLAFLNRWFGGHAITRSLLGEHVRRDESFSLLDVGAASGDFARAIRKAFPHARVTCLDLQPRHLAHAPPPRVIANAFAIPFPDRAFDFVHCSLFLHHFVDAQVVELLSAMYQRARRALVLQDLERHPLAYRFLPLTSPFFRWNRITLHDGPISVAAAFAPSELLSLAREARIPAPVVRQHPPFFRLSLSARASASS